MLLLLVLGLVASLGHSQVISSGKCPDFTTKLDFEVEPYLGIWYEIVRFPDYYEAESSCNYAEYTDRGDGTVGVHNAGFDVHGIISEIYGYAELTDVPGALTLYLNGIPFTGSYNVLDTDYTAYACVYSCTNILGIGHAEQAWILGRARNLTSQEMDSALAAFSQWGIDTDVFISTPQEGCTIP